MSGDGVSLQTNVVQLATVAKATARSANAGTAAPVPPENAETREAQRAHRVVETEKAERQRVDPDHKHERDHRQDPGPERPLVGEETPEAPESAEDAAPGSVGVLIDTKA